jgi:SAM-dependent methyltransferase
MNVINTTKRVARNLLGPRGKVQRIFWRYVKHRVGLEIGGPSDTFGDAGILPLYRYIRKLDNCVFSAETIWEGQRLEGQTFTYHPNKPRGFNFIRESTDLLGIKNSSYDFILASHTLEHTTNPIKALKEWIRVVKPGGPIIVILPHYRYTFDHRRQPTPVSHMAEDYERDMDEKDDTHLNEILDLHDLSLDPPAGTPQQFRARSLLNIENRCLHHHVFDENNSPGLLEAAGLDVEILRFINPFHIVMLAQPKNTQHVTGSRRK